MKLKFPDDKTYAMLTEAEIDRRKQLTPKEAKDVAAVVAAVEALSPYFRLHLDEDGLVVQKRVTNGAAMAVAVVRKRSLHFL